MTLMTTEEKKEWLLRYRRAVLRQQAMHDDIEALRAARMYPGTLLPDGMPHSSSGSDLSEYAAALDDLLDKWDKGMEKRLKIRQEIQTAIDQLESSDEAAVLMYRYLSLVQSERQKRLGLEGTRKRTFEDIARRMGYSVDGVLVLHRKGLKNLVIPEKTVQ